MIMSMIRPETEMKDTGIEWIGIIPSSWTIFPANGVFSEVKEKNTDLKLTNAFSFKYGEIVDKKQVGDVDNNLKETLSSYTIVRKNTIMINGLNLNYDFVSQRVAIVNESGVITSAYLAIQPDENKINPRFVLYLLKSYDYQQVFHGLGSGIRKTLKYQNFKKIMIVAPTLSEQQAIADYLDETCSEIDEIIAEAKASIDEYKELKQSVIFETVTKGLDKNVEMKDSGYDFIGYIPSKWEMCKVRHLGTAQNGISIGGDAFGLGHPFVSYGDVYKNYSLPKTVDKLVQSSEEDRKRYSVEKGDWFFTRTSETIEEVGFSCVCEETIPDAVFAGFLIRIRPFNNRIYTGFAKYYFRSNHLRTFFVKEMNLVTRASLAQGLLKDAPVIVPPYDKQIEIANYLENRCAVIDGVIKDKESTIADLEAYKKSLIYEVVTGKRRVV